MNKDGFDDFVAVSDSGRIYFGASEFDSIPKIITPWAAPMCHLGNINSDQYNDIACGRGGWEPSKIYIYSYGFPDNVNESSFNYPKYFNLNQNYPNPFNGETVIEYQLLKQEFVTLEVYNSLGQIVATLCNSWKSEGIHRVHYNAGNLSSGIYFYKLKTQTGIICKKMMLLR